MPLRFLIIGPSPKNSLNTADLVREIEQRGHSASVCSISKLLFLYTDNRYSFFLDGVNVVESFDILIPRSFQKNIHFARMLVQLFQKNNKVVLDSIIGGRDMAGKIFQASVFAQHNIPHPKTLATLSLKSFEKNLEQLGLPLVAKPIQGSQGKGVLLLHSKETALSFFKEHRQDYFFQEKIDLTSDYRVLIVGGEVLGAIERIAPPNDFRTNASLGAITKTHEASPEMKNLALKASQALGYDISGVDVIKTPVGYLILEVNHTPQWQAFQSSTGVNVAEKIVDFALKQQRSLSI